MQFWKNNKRSLIIKKGGTLIIHEQSHKRKLKILMLAEHPYFQEDEYLGGVMQASFRLTRALSISNEIDLYVVTQSKHIKKKEVRKEGNATIIYLPFYFRGNDAILLYSIFRKQLHEIISDVLPDLIHAQGDSQFILSAVKSNIPHVVTVHGLFQNEMKVYKSNLSLREKVRKIFVINLERYYLSKIKNLIAITSEISSIVKKYSPNVNIFMIDNPIDANFFEIIDTSRKPTILFVAAITYRKGLHILLKAFESLQRKIPDIKLRIAGIEHWDPTYVNTLKKNYQSYLESEDITFLGTISQAQLYEELSNCSLLCLPSLAESAPMVIAQSLAAGKPVISTKVGGIPDMIDDKVTGILLEPNNIEMLERAIEEIILDSGKLKKMGIAARQSAMNKYHPEVVAQKTIQAYWTVLKR